MFVAPIVFNASYLHALLIRNLSFDRLKLVMLLLLLLIYTGFIQ